MPFPSRLAHYGLTAAIFASCAASPVDNGVENPRHAVKGHDAFIQRCTTDTTVRNLAAWAPGVDFETLPQANRKSFMEGSRKICRIQYEEIGVSDVCADGEAATALDEMEKRITRIKSVLDGDSSLRESEELKAMLATDEWEAMVLRKLIANPSLYCDGDAMPDPRAVDAVDETQEAATGHEAFVLRCVAKHLDGVNEDGIEEVRELATETCNADYEDLNVCADEDVAHAIKKFEYKKSHVERTLRQLSGDSEDAALLPGVIESYEAELSALRDVRDGRSGYCNPDSTGEE